MDRITADIDRDYILRDEDALRYGVVDHLIWPEVPRPQAALPEPSDVLGATPRAPALSGS